jgi:hypothetical protein
MNTSTATGRWLTSTIVFKVGPRPVVSRLREDPSLYRKPTLSAKIRIRAAVCVYDLVH